MTKEEYLAALETALAGRMPPGQLESTMVYYREYFDEAGPGRVQQVIADLGGPEELADRLVGAPAASAGAAGREVRYGAPPRRPGLWGALMEVFSAPASVPVILLAVLLAIAAMAAAVVLAVGGCAGGLACAAAGVFTGIKGFSVLFTGGLGATLLLAGLGVLAIGVGLLLAAGLWSLAGLCLRGAAELLCRMAHGREEWL